MTHRTLGFVRWTIRPDRDIDAPPTTYAFRCLGEDENDKPCGAESTKSENFALARGWTFDHLREHPGHTSYAEVLQRPWVMWRGGPT